ncbi:MAG: dephospho-CoA kinase [Lachnospiraceae bacterium]|nr:dephospho-CoA kinase [Lachnospiraceae bacterium]
MKIIGITGGVGAGKSSVLKYIKDNYNCVVVTADDIGNEVKEPGEECYERLITLLGRGILDTDGRIDKKKMAEAIFADEDRLNAVESIIHPAVIDRIRQKADMERSRGKVDYFFIEAALLIECGFNDYVDQMWYIYASQDVRRKRLKQSRGYDDSRIDGIMNSQLTDEAFKNGSDVVIDNGGDFEDTIRQIDEGLSKIQTGV